MSGYARRALAVLGAAVVALVVAPQPAAAEGPPPVGWQQQAQFGQSGQHPLAFTSLSDMNRDGVTDAFLIWEARPVSRSVVVCADYPEPRQCWDTRSGQVTRLYLAYFGRLPDNTGFRWWMYAPETFRLSLAETSRQFYNAPEFEQQRQLSDRDLVTYMYVTYLGRQPDSAGYDYWVGLLRAGHARPDIIRAFSETPENKSFHWADFDHWRLMPGDGREATYGLGVLVINGSCAEYSSIELPCRTYRR